MSTTSTVPSVRAALVAGLQARAGLGQVQVSRRWPGPDTESEGIWLGDVEGTSVISGVKKGRQRRQETYNLEVIIQTLQASETPQDPENSEDRAYVLLGELEDMLAENPRVGLGPGSVISFAGWTETTPPFGPGWATRITAVVNVQAHIN